MFPHLRALGDPEELEEERRLAYVGITRARESLFLSHAWSRMLHGSDPVQPAQSLPGRDPVDLMVEAEGSRKVPGRQGWRRHGAPGSPDSSPSRRRTSGSTPVPPCRMDGRGESGAEPEGQVFGGGRGRPARDPGPSSTMAHELGLAVGDDVVHRAWGDGVVLSVSGEGDRAEAVVRFRRQGRQAAAPGLGSPGASGRRPDGPTVGGWAAGPVVAVTLRRWPAPLGPVPARVAQSEERFTRNE